MTSEQLDLWKTAKQAGVTAVTLAYGTTNIGDDIQTLAAMKWFDVTTTVARDHPSGWGKEKVVLSGWFGGMFLPEGDDVIVIGFHLHPASYAGLLKEGAFKRLKVIVEKQGFPAGARDTFTMDKFNAMGIPSVFSGCVTQTLPKHEGKRKGKYATDCKAPNKGWKDLSHTIPRLRSMDAPGRLAAAQRRIDLYMTAEKVITSRLHAFLPSVAMGVPVVKVKFDTGLTNPERWTGHLP